MAAVAFDSLQWTSTPMPGSAQPLQLARLPAASDGAFRAFVRFPAGWHRADAGYYEAAEEFLLLEGELELNGTTWAVNRPAWIPAFEPRRDLGSATGCLVLAWFSAGPCWVSGNPPRAPGGGRMHSVQILERGPAPYGSGCETLGMRSRYWQADEASPPLDDEPVLVRRWPGPLTSRSALP